MTGFDATEMAGFDARETGSLIIGFKKMRDDDLITEDEFEAKKKQLLGLASSF
jgi:hypothetical protein